MKIGLYPPFHTLEGEVVELHLAREMTLEEFCGVLAERLPGLMDYLPFKDAKSADLLSYVFFVVNRKNPGRLLQPADIVRDEDFLQLLPPFDGG